MNRVADNGTRKFVVDALHVFKYTPDLSEFPLKAGCFTKTLIELVSTDKFGRCCLPLKMALSKRLSLSLSFSSLIALKSRFGRQVDGETMKLHSVRYGSF